MVETKKTLGRALFPGGAAIGYKSRRDILGKLQIYNDGETKRELPNKLGKSLLITGKDIGWPKK